MTDAEIAALADGMAPFVRECVAEAFKVSPELAEQVASAVRMLHESPPISALPEGNLASGRAGVIERPLRISRIERDDQGNLVPIYEARS